MPKCKCGQEIHDPPYEHWEECPNCERRLAGLEYARKRETYVAHLESEIVELRELSKVRDDETAGEFVERRIQDIFQEVAEHVGNGLFELDHPAPIIRGSIRMTNAWKDYLDDMNQNENPTT